MKKNGILILAVLTIFALPTSFAMLECYINSSCNAGLGEIEMLGISELANGHLSLPGFAYSNKVCCFGLAGLTNTGGIGFLNLTENNNAHAGKIIEQNYSLNYARIASSGPMDCLYNNTCPSEYACLASIEKDSNAHAGNCTAYPAKVCCACKYREEISCSDGIDNDCDGFTDCDDNECDGTIMGTVKDIDNINIAGALVKALKGILYQNSGLTDNNGDYIIPIKCGTFNIAVGAIDYATVTKIDIVVPPHGNIILDFIGEDAIARADTCESDCTFPGRNIIHSSCSNLNGCSFYDVQSAIVCDNAQPGWVREYAIGQKVTCPNGNPFASVQVGASIDCTTNVCVSTSSPVLYNGQQVKMVVVVAGK